MIAVPPLCTVTYTVYVEIEPKEGLAIQTPVDVFHHTQSHFLVVVGGGTSVMDA